MTEEEWLKATDPRAMLEFLGRQVSPRKLRLLIVAYCHRIWLTLTGPEYREAVELAERYADGTANTGQLEAMFRRVSRFHYSMMRIPERRIEVHRDLTRYAQRHVAVVATLCDDRLWLTLTRGAQV